VLSELFTGLHDFTTEFVWHFRTVSPSTGQAETQTVTHKESACGEAK
jgi:hypothetical protein